MVKLAVSSTAQTALVKLLVKLGLVAPQGEDGSSFQSLEFCPISYYARRGHFQETDALQKVANALGIEFCHLSEYSSEKIDKILEDSTLADISLSRWKETRAVPIEISDKGILLAMANPLDHEIVGALEFNLGVSVGICIAAEAEIIEALARKQGSEETISLDEILSETEEKSSLSILQKSGDLESNLVEGDHSAPPIVRLVNKIFAEATSRGASDIHLEPDRDGLDIRVRVDGIMTRLLKVPQYAKNSVISRIKLLAGLDISERRKPQDGRLRVKTISGNKDLRISTMPTVHGENIVARILSSDLGTLTFDSLGMENDLQTAIRKALKGSSKVVFVSGPTGSGKTSTLYACLLHLRDGKTTIITVEDPIEYRIEGISQVQVNPKIGLTFAEGLRSILRQDPDTIMVGEIRDSETASIAMQAAQTGHLVLSTIHTNTAAATFARLKDLGVPLYIIASSVGGILAQRLVRRLCPQCAVELDSETADRYRALGLEPRGQIAVGCDACSGYGYRGRVGVYSFLEVNDSVREVVRRDASEREIEESAREFGFSALEEAGLELLNAGLTSLDELERVLGALDDVCKSFRNQQVEQESTVTIEPLPPVVEAPVQVASEAPKNTLSKQKILLVEDDENLSETFKILFEREMFDVVHAQNGFEALEKVYEVNPAIIVSDLMMPEMNGLEFLQKLRSNAGTKKIPVLILTASDSPDVELNLINSGADDFVSKTSTPALILARVHNLLLRTRS